MSLQRRGVTTVRGAALPSFGRDRGGFRSVAFGEGPSLKGSPIVWQYAPFHRAISATLQGEMGHIAPRNS